MGDSYYDCWEFYTLIVGDCWVGLGWVLGCPYHLCRRRFCWTASLLSISISLSSSTSFHFLYTHMLKLTLLYSRVIVALFTFVYRSSLLFRAELRISFILLLLHKENKEIIKIRFLSDWSHSQNMPGTTSFRSIYVRTDQIDQLPFTSETSKGGKGELTNNTPCNVLRLRTLRPRSRVAFLCCLQGVLVYRSIYIRLTIQAKAQDARHKFIPPRPSVLRYVSSVNSHYSEAHKHAPLVDPQLQGQRRIEA